MSAGNKKAAPEKVLEYRNHTIEFRPDRELPLKLRVYIDGKLAGLLWDLTPAECEALGRQLVDKLESILKAGTATEAAP